MGEFFAPAEEVTATREQISDAARQSPDFLAGLAMPEIFEYNWPDLFIAAWSWLVDAAEAVRQFQRFALGLPRGFGKTTFIKLFCLYCILFTDRKFILVISATATHAENIISDICDMLDEPNIKAVFGDWRIGLETDTKAVKKFGFRGRNIIIAGLGAGGAVRGLNLKNERPDLIIFEDVQKREEADSQQVSEDLYKWMLGTAMKAKSPKGCLTLFIGNMYPTPHSILKKLKANPTWDKFIVGGILADGTSLWEDLQPINQLLDEYESDTAAGHPEIFHAEVLNDENAQVNNLIDFSKIPAYRFDDSDIPQGKFIVIDPSNDKANSDAVSIGYFEIHEHMPALRKVIEDRLSPADTIRHTLKLALESGTHFIVIEANAYQYSLKFWFDFICTQMGIQGIYVHPIYSGSLSKNTRIMTMLKSYSKGEILVHPDCQVQVHAQMTAFAPLRRDNVDGILDLLTYSPRVISEFAGYLEQFNPIEEQTMQYQESIPYSTQDNSSF